MGDYRKYIEDDIRATRTPMYREKLQELDEVYRKAEAFDEMKDKYAENLNYVKGLTEDGLEGSVFHEMVLGASVINYFRESEESE